MNMRLESFVFRAAPKLRNVTEDDEGSVANASTTGWWSDSHATFSMLGNGFRQDYSRVFVAPTALDAPGRYLVGGSGDDVFYVDNPNDVVIERANGGNDRVIALISYTLTPGSHIEILSTASESGTVAINLAGNEFANSIYGNNGGNVLDGRGGADFLLGLGGDDVYYVDDIGDQVVEYANGGNDRIFSSVSYTLNPGSHVEILSTTFNAGTMAINLAGNELANSIYGNDGGNVLDGRGGADFLLGLGGDDIYYVDDIGDQVLEYAGGGNDRIFASVSYTLNPGSHVELLSTIFNAGTAAINLAGNELANSIYGNDGANILDGRGGADFLLGLGGDDSYYVDNIGDQVLEYAGGGNDRIYSSVSYTLNPGSHVEILSTTFNDGTAAINLAGNDLVNTLYGNNGSNILDGRGGADIMQGLGGDDYYYVDDAADRVIEFAGGGDDRVYTSVSWALTAGMHIETLSTDWNAGTAAINLYGNEQANVIYGNAGVNVLDGGYGNDILWGLGGADFFRFSAALDSSQNLDRIVGFDPNEDFILFDSNAAGYFTFAPGALEPSYLSFGTASGYYRQLVYDRTTGVLSYDQDGEGAGAAIAFAVLEGAPMLTASDIWIGGYGNSPPAVQARSIELSIPENSFEGRVVSRIVAFDPDGDYLQYSIQSSTTTGEFSINERTGEITLVRALDYEASPTFSLVIRIFDGQNSTHVNVNGLVADLDDRGATPSFVETEPNDSFETAMRFNREWFLASHNDELKNDDFPSVSIRGRISSLSDKDYYAASLNVGEGFVIDIDRTTGGLDTWVRVFDSTGKEVYANDDNYRLDPGSTNFQDSYIVFRPGKSDIYYFVVESFGQESTGDYVLNISRAPLLSDAEIHAENVEALLSGVPWTRNQLTFGFPRSGADYNGEAALEVANNFAAFTASQQIAVRGVLAGASQFSNLSFTEISGSPGSADLRYGRSDEADPAFAYLPGPGNGGDSWYQTSDTLFDDVRIGTYGFATFLHETGHALGLKHGHEAPALSWDRDSLEYSVMTYASHIRDDNTGYTNETGGYPQSFMMYDIAALQQMYGANFAHNSGDTVYSWRSGTGEMVINGAGQGIPAANRVFTTVWDGGGIDTYDFRSYQTAVTIDLRPGEWSISSATQLANLGEGYTARGNVANALLYNGDTRSLIENAIGGAGGDTLIANQAKNVLTGGSGADIFKWYSASHSAAGANADIIDFRSGTDKIDLSAIDAVPGAADNPFIFLGTGAFTGGAGQLRYEAVGGQTHILADLDGDRIADFQIVVTTQQTIVAGDFVL